MRRRLLVGLSATTLLLIGAASGPAGASTLHLSIPAATRAIDGPSTTADVQRATEAFAASEAAVNTSPAVDTSVTSAQIATNEAAVPGNVWHLRFPTGGCVTASSISTNAPVVTKVCTRSLTRLQRWVVNFRGTTRARLRLYDTSLCVYDTRGGAVLHSCLFDTTSDWLVSSYSRGLLRLTRYGGIFTKDGLNRPILFLHRVTGVVGNQREQLIR